MRQLTIYKFTGKCDVTESIMKVVQYFDQIIELDQIETWTKIVEKTMNSLEGNANVKLSFISLGIESGKIQNRSEYESYINTI